MKIYKIEEIEVQNRPVYDIQLDKNHYFAANGIITHNCRLKNKIQTKEFNFTNGNIGVETGSKSVITLNLNRIIQNFKKTYSVGFEDREGEPSREFFQSMWTMSATKKEFKEYLSDILERVYKYHTAYNELLWDMYNANLLPVYKAGFIDLNKQYLTIGINGLNEAAEFLGFEINDNPKYAEFCRTVFGIIKEQNAAHKTAKLNFNTECVPAESLAIKNYNWDKADGYVVPEDRNLYASYIYIPSDETTSVPEKIRMHGNDYIGEALDGGSAAHINLDSHLSVAQYKHLIKYAAEVGCSYLTFNIPNCECSNPKCGYISKQPFNICPKCGSSEPFIWDRIIGYLTKTTNWTAGRQKERLTRVYAKNIPESF